MKGLRFPQIMPAWCYRDPALQYVDRAVAVVSRETAEAVQTPAPINKPDRYYTQARRLHIRNLMRGRT